jgi:hypothetical protein
MADFVSDAEADLIHAWLVKEAQRLLKTTNEQS